MTSTNSTEALTSWQLQASQYLAQANYAQAAQLYEQAIESNPEERSYYWQLGLLLLLQGEEAEAQTTWLFAMSEGEPDQVEQWVAELAQVLQTEAERREALTDYSTAWAIRQHLREVSPNLIYNVLQLLQLSIELDLYTDDTLEELELPQSLQGVEVNSEFLLHVLETVLYHAAPTPSLLKFAEGCISLVPDTHALMQVLLPAAIRFAHSKMSGAFAADLVEAYLRFDPDSIEFLGHLSLFYHNAKQYDRSIQVGERRYELTNYLPEKIFSNHLILRGLLGAGGYWQEALKIAERHESLLQTLVEQQPTDVHSVSISRLLNSSYYLVYFYDQPQRWRTLENQVLEYCQKNIQLNAANKGRNYQHSIRDRAPKRLKIGYLSHCMATHSVGWLARCLLQHHDRDRFELYGYFLSYRKFHDPLQEWYVNQFEHVHKIETVGLGTNLMIATQIHEDEIDILIDLDSITLDLTCEILALKPAPVQATWLGWDASGLPAIDYFIADPYVLPDSAQDYYSEKIVRLPQTYIAVDGFEVGIPTLRREHLEIPNDAIVFLSAQRGYKRHRDTVKLQMRILKQVPNSYFLIKGLSDQESISKFFAEIAEEEGVSSDRLRFLPDDPSVEIHRANLAIADVVLDTFPYNGATTTLEALWMEIPLVTRVGEQFAARNSYTMLTNAGLTEGIAWTDDEYVNWGVRLGTDAALRQQIAWKLKRSKQTAPLWNGKQFTREMEKAYEQMWATYLATSESSAELSERS
ncbi:O-linked N-acetylglucosamine transferase, SPINDLY family protein [Phormidesmis priestleyi]|uniref:O-linked N-acetylglucosamine transferase, SPINDLY family protein n=1 Tax=Phormidesmis priestleyi TaxID=268141 RepID=UPI00083AC07D|nr:O-linked N-acetylglucosamine transferase, SPINDLY family protein [Phormidesmis priestleyi]